MLATGFVGAADDPWIRWDWVSRHLDVIGAALSQHIELTIIAVGLGVLIAVPLGLLAWRERLLRGPIFSVTGILYTIPSLALFSFLIPFTGLTILTAEIGLVSYTLLILIRNIVIGLDSVPADVREAAVGMGYRPLKQLAQVEIPLAVPAIIAGIRIATVTTIGLVTVTALIGEGGLGSLILDGLIRDSKTLLVIAVELVGIGAVPAFVALLALGIPPIVTNSYIGMREVDADVREAARGMGMRGPMVLWRVELPIALPFIMAGIRTSAVNIVATATLAALVAWGGLGRFIVDGLGQQNYPMLYAGAILVGLLSLIVEFSLAGLQRLATPAGLRTSKIIRDPDSKTATNLAAA